MIIKTMEFIIAWLPIIGTIIWFLDFLFNTDNFYDDE